MFKIRVILIRFNEQFILKKYILIASTLILSSCATPDKWEAKTTNPSPLEIAKEMCLQQAKERYPVMLSSSPSPSFSPMIINGVSVPNPGNGHSFSSDRNEWARKDYFNTCMKAEGWENKTKVTGLLGFLFN